MIEIDVKSSLRGASVAGNYPVICALIMEFLDDLESNCIYHEQSTNIRIEITTSWSKFALLSQIPDSRIKVRTHSFNYRRIGVLQGIPPGAPSLLSDQIDEFSSISISSDHVGFNFSMTIPSQWNCEENLELSYQIVPQNFTIVQHSWSVKEAYTLSSGSRTTVDSTARTLLNGLLSVQAPNSQTVQVASSYLVADRSYDIELSLTDINGQTKSQETSLDCV